VVKARPFSKKKTGVGLAISISRKASPKAVDRNLWKRRIREVIRSSESCPDAGTFLLIKGKPQKKVPCFKELKEEIEKLLEAAFK
jgi:ribonuclease P protein component